MYLTKTKRSPYYQIVFFQYGKPTTKSTKQTKKSAALKYLSEFEKNLQRKKEIKSLSLTEYKEKYINFLTGQRAAKYLRSVDCAFRQFENYAGNIQLKNISVMQCDSFVSKVYSSAPHSAAAYYRILKAALNKAVIWNYLIENPFDKIKAPRVEKSFPVFITPVQLKFILSNVKSPLYKDIFLFAFHTGLRIGELVNLTWFAVNLADRNIIVRNTETFTTKSKRERIIPLNDIAFEILSRRFP